MSALWPGWRPAHRGDLAQLLRCEQFKHAHPEADVYPVGSMVQVHFTHGGQDVTFTRPTLREVLDRAYAYFGCGPSG